jgi:hypothetical protein
MSGHAIHIKVDGRTSGTYTVDCKMLTVTTTYGRKSAEIAPRVRTRLWPTSSCRNWCSRRSHAKARRSTTTGGPEPSTIQ